MIEADQVVDIVADMSSDEIAKYLNIDVLQRFKEKNLDYNAFTYARPCKCMVIGGGSTMHEFLQPMIAALKSNEKMRIFNYLRVDSSDPGLRGVE